MDEELGADLEAHILEVRHTELHEERELLEATPLDDLYTAPTHTITDNSALATVAGEQRGRLPTPLRHREDGSCPTFIHGRRP
eukprot:2696338-Pyramimonas_sp.AAC.1